MKSQPDKTSPQKICLFLAKKPELTLFDQRNQPIAARPGNITMESAKYSHVHVATSRLRNRYNIADDLDIQTQQRQIRKFLSPISPDKTAEVVKVTPVACCKTRRLERESSLSSKVSLTNAEISQSCTGSHSKFLTPLRDSKGKTSSKLGTTRDVSYMKEAFNKPAPESSSQKKLPETVKELMQLSPDTIVAAPSPFSSSGDHLHLLLKQDLFKRIPPEFYRESQQTFFSGLLTTTQRESLTLSHNRRLSESNEPAGFLQKLEEKAGLGVPSSRNDAIVLDHWLDSITQKLVQDPQLEEDRRFELMQTVYFLSFQELIRQISVHCVERGVLVWKLWKAYVALIRSLGERHKRKLGKMLARHEDQIVKIHSHYGEEISVLETSGKDTRQRLEIKSDELAELRLKFDKMEIELRSEKTASEASRVAHAREAEEYEETRQKYYKTKDALRDLNEEHDALIAENIGQKEEIKRLIALNDIGKETLGIQTDSAGDLLEISAIADFTSPKPVREDEDMVPECAQENPMQIMNGEARVNIVKTSRGRGMQTSGIEENTEFCELEDLNIVVSPGERKEGIEANTSLLERRGKIVPECTVQKCNEITIEGTQPEEKPLKVEVKGIEEEVETVKVQMFDEEEQTDEYIIPVVPREKSGEKAISMRTSQLDLVIPPGKGADIPKPKSKPTHTDHRRFVSPEDLRINLLIPNKRNKVPLLSQSTTLIMSFCPSSPQIQSRKETPQKAKDEVKAPKIPQQIAAETIKPPPADSGAEKLLHELKERLKAEQERALDLHKQNEALSGEAARKEKAVNELTEKNKQLEVENFLLKDKLDSIKERVGQLESEVQNLTKLIEKLEGEKDRSQMGQLIRGIKDVGKEQTNVCEKIDELGREFIEESHNTSFDFCKEVADIHEMPAAIVEETITVTAKRPERISSKSLITKKSNNKIVARLTEKVLHERCNVYAMPKKLLLKTITHTYNEALLLMLSSSQALPDLSDYIFGTLLNKFGLPSAAERKFLQILAGCLRYKNCRRVRIFGRFLGLYEDYQNEDLKNYLTMMKAVSAAILGIKVRNLDSDENSFVPYVNAHEYARLKFEAQSADWLRISEEVANIKEKGIAGKGIGGLVDLDVFGELMIKRGTGVTGERAEGFGQLFAAADMDACGRLRLDEFELLLLSFEGHLYSKEQAKALFSQHATRDDPRSELLLSAENFAILAAKHSFFSLKTQRKFLGFPTEKDYDEKRKLAVSKSSELISMLRARLQRAGTALPLPKWDRRLGELSKRLIAGSKIGWISYRIMDEYTASMMKRREMERLFPVPLNTVVVSINSGSKTSLQQ